MQISVWSKCVKVTLTEVQIEQLITAENLLLHRSYLNYDCSIPQFLKFYCPIHQQFNTCRVENEHFFCIPWVTHRQLLLQACSILKTILFIRCQGFGYLPTTQPLKSDRQGNGRDLLQLYKIIQSSEQVNQQRSGDAYNKLDNRRSVGTACVFFFTSEFRYIYCLYKFNGIKIAL